MAARGKTARKEQAPVSSAPPRPGSVLASRKIFLSRFRRTASYALALVGITLVVGMIGYHALEHLSWLDAFHQAALLLSGMGPVIDIKSTAGKLFDGIYALFCGVILLASTALLFAPVIHRLLHRFHIEDAGER
ncbi:MAG TPA: hypothetical protein VKU81_00310 [Casimicrobiaceae bacterium]|nr:hypothetical protein [Casimicrobiaceae bacterium]